MSESENWVTAAQVGERAQISTRQVLKLYELGVIPGIRISDRSLRFDWDKVVASLEEREQQRRTQRAALRAVDNIRTIDHSVRGADREG